jgi:hypothetical protein
MNMHIQDFTAIVGNPAKQFLWEVIIPALPFSAIKAQSTQFPGVGSTDIELWHMGQSAKFVGTVEYEHTWNCSIVESESGDVFNAMYAWKQLCFDQKTGSMQDVAAYKRDITIKALTSAGNAWATIKLKGAYPKSIDTVEMDKSANTESFKFQLQFNYDYWHKA